MSVSVRVRLCVCVLHLLVLHHVHDDPVGGIHVLADENFEHDERFHEEILQRTRKKTTKQQEVLSIQRGLFLVLVYPPPPSWHKD